MSESRLSPPLSLIRLGGDTRAGRLARQLASFLMVGGVGFVLDVGLFNLLRATVLDPDRVDGGAIAAKAISTLAAIGVNWLGNRLVTFRHRRSSRVGREALEFFAASLLGSSVSLLCLAVTHYALGFTSAAADNLSANVVGLGLGTVLRFVLYRGWVFSSARRGADAPAAETEPARSELPVP